MTVVDRNDSEFEFDVALSFAGEDREFVEEIASALKKTGVRLFLDSDQLAEMWGEDLVEYFDQVFRTRSRYALIFVSRFYGDRMWPRHERRSALARGLEDSRPYVLPIRLDDSALDGLRPTVGYLDARRLGLDGIVAATRAKLSGNPQISKGTDRVPRSEIERQGILAERPPGWEYLYLAGELLHLRDGLNEKYLDFETEYAPLVGTPLDEAHAGEWLSSQTDDARRIAKNMMRAMDPAVQERAVGRRGEPGDPERIRHMAQRWNALYEGLLDWAARLRGQRVPDEFAQACLLLSRFVETPIQQYRDFVDHFV